MALWTYSFPMYSTWRNFLRVFGCHLKTLKSWERYYTFSRVRRISWLHKQLPFSFCVYFERSPSSKRTLGHYVKGAPPILYVPTFPWKYFFFMKQERREEIKRELFMQGEVLVPMHSPKVWEHSGACTLGCPFLRKTHSNENLPYNLREQGSVHTLKCRGRHSCVCIMAQEASLRSIKVMECECYNNRICIEIFIYLFIYLKCS